MKEMGSGKYLFTQHDEENLKKVLPLTMVKEVVIADGIETISNNYFSGYCNMDKVTIPDSVTVIDHDGFEGCFNLKTVELPKNLKAIKSFAFRECHSLGSGNDGVLIIPRLVNVIENFAFTECFSLKTIVLCNPKTIVEKDAFYRCDVKIYRSRWQENPPWNRMFDKLWNESEWVFFFNTKWWFGIFFFFIINTYINLVYVLKEVISWLNQL